MSDQQKLTELATESVGRLLWRYSLPAVVGMVVMSLYNIIDSIFIGQGCGPDAIAGLAITFPVMNISAALGVLVGAGGSARISILLGAGNHRAATHTLGNSLTLTIILAVSYLTLFWIFLDEILYAFGADEDTIPYARDFMLYILPGLLMTNLSFSFNNLMRASGYPVRAMVTNFIGAGSNLVLAPIFIFWLDMGIKGAAIATDIAMTITMVFVMAHFFRRESTIHFERGTYALRWRIVWGIVSIGAAPSIVNFCACFINVLINNSLHEFGGNAAIGAVGVFSRYTSLLTMVIIGITQGLQPIIGYNYGAGQLDRLKRSYWLAVGAATILCCVGAAFGISCPALIGRAFTTDPEMIHATVKSLTIALLAFWFVGFQIVSTTFFQSIGQAGKSIFLSLTRQVLFFIPLVLILPRHWGLEGVWASFPASDLAATIVTAAMMVWQLRKLDRAVLAR